MSQFEPGKSALWENVLHEQSVICDEIYQKHFKMTWTMTCVVPTPPPIPLYVVRPLTSPPPPCRQVREPQGRGSAGGQLGDEAGQARIPPAEADSRAGAVYGTPVPGLALEEGGDAPLGVVPAQRGDGGGRTETAGRPGDTAGDG